MKFKNNHKSLPTKGKNEALGKAEGDTSLPTTERRVSVTSEEVEVIEERAVGGGVSHYTNPSTPEELAALQEELDRRQANAVVKDECTRRINAAARLLVSGQFDEGIAAWLAIGEEWPIEKPLAWSQVGAAYYFKGEYSRAIEFYQKAKGGGMEGMEENIEEAEQALAAL